MEQGVFEKLGEKHQVFLVVKVIMQSQQAFLVSIAVGLDVFENFDFVKGLVKVFLIVLDDFEAVALVVGQVFNFDRVRELSLSQV